MATITLGTPAATTLTALTFNGQLNTTDLATIANSILDDQNNLHLTWPGAWAQTGFLYIPNRGVLKCLPGDIVGVDTVGWPILVSSRSAGTGASWTHT